MARIRTSAVAGKFYPDDPTELKNKVTHFLETAGKKDFSPKITTQPKALIVPHAGYRFSGEVAASAYQTLIPYAHNIEKVILLGPCHKVPVTGIALSNAEHFDTPLGPIVIDQALNASINQLPQIKFFDRTHEHEHSLEVHLPFLKTILKDFTLLPMVVGKISAKLLSDALELVWGDEKTLIVVSTDLSHYLNYQQSKELDAKTTQAIEQLLPHQIGHNQACGRYALKGLLINAKIRSMQVQTLEVKNSGDTPAGANNHDRVVGYGSWALFEKNGLPKDEAFAHQTRIVLRNHGITLLKIAAFSIRYGVEKQQPAKIKLSALPKDLSRPAAVFITLETRNGQLRGCIGHVKSKQPLAQAVANNAYRAAFLDKRFKPVQQSELPYLNIHISILSPNYSFGTLNNESDLLTQLRPGKDGLIIQDNDNRGVFLPSVWKKIPNKINFLKQLKRKAGMTEDHWSEDFIAWRFITESIHSNQLKSPEIIWGKKR